MESAFLQFSSSLSVSDPHQNPVLIIGLSRNLSQIKYQDIQVKFGPRVTEEVFSSALHSVQSSSEPCPLYLNTAILAALPAECSRHNTPSRAHAITKLIQSYSKGSNESIVIVCQRNDCFASACAVARAFPLFSRKTKKSHHFNSQNERNQIKTQPVVNVEFIFVGNDNEKLTDEECQMLETAAESIRLAARIVDTPCNEMNTIDFLKEIQLVGDELGISPVIIQGEELNRRGFGGIYGVGKAAEHPPALGILSHTPQGASRTIAWVGKGIVYDAGGLSIIARTSLLGMKRDCGGAAAVLGAFRFAVRQGFTENLHAIFCLAENAVGPLCTRPDDIHTLYSGKTVEINNTDAEGRLVLADGVAYARKDLKADVILDIATLTGAQGISTGKYHAAVITNKEKWEDPIMKAGLSSGDLTFPVPFCPELHFPEFTSAVADMINSVADKKSALPSSAGLFILSHIGFDFPGSWIHIDMAIPVYCGERATGYGVALLSCLFGCYTRSSLLQRIGPNVDGISKID